MSSILVVDDDPALGRALRIALSARGYTVIVARTGREGVEQVALSAPDVVVLDLGLDDLDGLEVCRRVRGFSEVPVIVLSASGDESAKVAALDGGADDYVTKPFSMPELEARLRVALRRARQPDDGAPAEVVVGGLELDLVHHGLRIAGRSVELTAREFDLLAYLARHVGKICTHHMILRDVWGPEYGTETNYLRVYVHRIRKKIGDDDGLVLRNHPGVGYELAPTAPPDPVGWAPDRTR